MNAIVCVDKNRGIGKDGKLLYHNKKDMEFFKETTTGKVVVMGRNTFLSLPHQQPLKDRINIVLTHDNNFVPSGALVARSIEELFEITKKYSTDDIFVIGGASVYEQLLPYCDTVYMTIIDTEPKEADTFFPREFPWVVDKAWVIYYKDDDDIFIIKISSSSL